MVYRTLGGASSVRAQSLGEQALPVPAVLRSIPCYTGGKAQQGARVERRRDGGFHSHGIVTPVLDDIITGGFSAYQSIEYGLNDLHSIIAQYGDRVSLWGNVNCDVVHAGPLEELPRLVAECLEKAAGLPGYAIGTDNSIFDDVPVEHFLAYHRALADQGVALETIQD